MRIPEDLTSKCFGRLTVVHREDDYIGKNGAHATQWLCKCVCGNTKIVLANSLKRGLTRSCGCLHDESVARNGKIKKAKDNAVVIKDGIAEFTATNNDTKFIVDVEDVDKVKILHWWESGNHFHAKQNRKIISLQNYLLNMYEEGFVVDHINRNPLDNRKCNLRKCTIYENNLNKKLKSNNTTGFTGVIVDKRNGRFVPYITYNKKRMTFGSYKTADEAATKRNEMEILYFKDFAPLNNINKLNNTNKGD